MTDQTTTQPAGTDKVPMSGRHLIEYNGQTLYYRHKDGEAGIVLLLSRALAENKPYILECDGWIYTETGKTIKSTKTADYKKFDFEII